MRTLPLPLGTKTTDNPGRRTSTRAEALPQLQKPVLEQAALTGSSRAAPGETLASGRCAGPG